MPPVKVATGAAGVHEAQGTWMGQAWLGPTVPLRNLNPGPPSWKIGVHQTTQRLCLVAAVRNGSPEKKGMLLPPPALVDIVPPGRGVLTSCFGIPGSGKMGCCLRGAQEPG